MFNLKRILGRETNTVRSESAKESQAGIEAQESPAVTTSNTRSRGRPKGSKDTKPRKAYTKKANPAT